MEDKPKSFFALIWDIILMSFKWYRDKKKIEEDKKQQELQQQINNVNKINENLENQYNRIDQQSNIIDNMTIDELKDKLNDEYK